jgi:uncharacterized damage-inducible protein DinB
MSGMDAVRSRWQRLQDSHRVLLDTLDGVDEDRMRRPGPDGGWSVIQIVGHLSLAEQHTLAYIRKKMQDPALPPAGALSFWRTAVVAVALRSPIRAKAPERTANPDADCTIAAARERWDGVRRDWGELVATLPPALADRAIFRHPRVGMMSLPHTLAFMREHVLHHRRQVVRRLAHHAGR